MPADDNQSSSWGSSQRPAHFDVKYHWLREKVKANKVELRYVNTHEQLADIFTKPLGVMQHNYHKHH